ncbi:hypothetical protein [Rubrobacter calidifluminis]|uniref:hypothetical protein n=1 Tax=Rubrobacter calidifluminis TaxID=1392640 RepID=UPI00235F6794|nr:hypothetical protein [Rubrobacter calidifluminis]
MTTGRGGESARITNGPGEAERLAETERQREDHLRSEMERGTSWISIVLGWLSALGAALVLSGVVSAIVGAVVKGGGNDVSSGGLSGLIGLLVTLFIAYLVGGYAAGRMASRGGAKHGLLVALLGLIVTVVALAAATVVGAGFADQLNNITLPSSPSTGASGHDISSIATASGILALLLPFAGGVIGGLWGARTGRRRGVPPWESRSLRTEGGED